MRKNILGVLFALLIQIPASHAANWDGGNPFVEMMRSMLNMFEMMQLYQNYSGYSNLYGMPRHLQPGQLDYAPFSGSYNSLLPYDGPLAPNQFAMPNIDGLWTNDTGILLLIRQNYAQIYWSRTEYKNYYLLKSQNRLQFTDAETGSRQTFDMVTQADQMALRDKDGKQLLFRKLSIEQLQSYQYQ